MPPLPKPADQRRRRNRTTGRMQLPAEGRRGRVPAWPMARAEPNERRLWEQAWHWPQAVAWERMGGGVLRAVARYVRVVIASDADSSSARYLAEIRALEDALGLNPRAMRSLEWEIVDQAGPPAKLRRPPRRRVRAVDPAALKA